MVPYKSRLEQYLHRWKAKLTNIDPQLMFASALAAVRYVRMQASFALTCMQVTSLA